MQALYPVWCVGGDGAGLAFSIGCEGGLLFTVAHELLHSLRPLDKALSNVLLCSVGYMHWTLSHLAHHRNVRPPPRLSLFHGKLFGNVILVAPANWYLSSDMLTCT